MIRNLVVYLIALVVIASSSARADLDVALNLRYTHPADPNQGGTWTLVAQSDDPNSNGITRLVTRFNDLAAAGMVNPDIGHDINGGALVIGIFGSQTEFVYGQDPNDGLTLGVGLVGGPSDQGIDPLLNSAWDNASVIAIGTFGGTRPTFVTASGNIDLSGSITAASIGLTNVRGDSLITLGLESPGGAGLVPGDANRDGFVGPADISALSGGFNSGPGATWGMGDFNGDGYVNAEDISFLSPYWLASGSPPAIGVVPEPTAIGLIALALLCFTSLGRSASAVRF